MSRSDQIMDNWKQKFETFEVQLPGGDWDEFKGKLDTKTRKRIVARRYIYTLLSICLLTIISLSTVLILQNKTNTTSVQQQSIHEKQQKKVPTDQKHEETAISNSKAEKPVFTVTKKTNKNNTLTATGKPNQITHEFVQPNNKSSINAGIDAISTSKKDEQVTDKSLEQIPELKKQIKTDTINLAFKVEKADSIPIKIQKADSLINPINKAEKASNTTKIACKIVFSPDYTYRKFQTNDAPKIHEDYSLLRNKSEKSAISFSLGVNLEFFVSKNLSITSGLLLDRFSTAGKYNFYNNKIPVIDSISRTIKGYITVNDTIGVYSQIKNSYTFLELPLILNYYVPLNKKWTFNIKAGGSMFYFLNSSGKTISADELVLKDVSSYSYNSINWGLILGLGCYYRVSDKLNLGFEPTYKQFLGSLMKKDELTGLKPWSVGINVNAQIKLK